MASLNQWTKVADIAKDVWSKILLSVPSSRLVVVARGGEDPEVRCGIIGEFTKRGVPERQLSVIGFQPLKSFLALLNTVDIALDPFPYGGGTTTLHSAWMGVPVVALETDSELGRGTPGILRAVGLAELVAGSIEAYLAIAIAAVTDVPRLEEYRRVLRDRLKSSSLTDSLTLTSSVENAYRAMWRAHCASGTR
jgi:predicted O-linked N-acetylglucosamine transferase (SPINDLY family)